MLDCGLQLYLKKTSSNLNLRLLNVSISGVKGGVHADSSSKIRVTRKFVIAVIDCVVADRVIDKLPTFTLKKADFYLPSNIKLANPHFHVSKIDLLISAEWFWDLLCVGQIKSSNKHPTLQKTRLEWILTSCVDCDRAISQSTAKLASHIYY